ncbi:MAG: SDR family NAD(P)-dependent oxidoreductase [Oscillospiraceae bacterium]
MEIHLKNKKALVTGGSGGLGRTISRTLAECGADVAIHYRSNQDVAEQLVDEIKGMGRNAAAVKADITSFESICEMKNILEADFGMPDILIVNAVIPYWFKPLLEQDPKDYYSQFESCVMQMVYLAKAFVPHMITQNYGRIVAMNTEASMIAQPTYSAYVAGKRGLDGIVRVLAKEVGEHNITVNQIAPGWTITDKERENGIDPAEGYVSSIPLRRRGTDEDIAKMAAFLSSDLASFTTGAYIPVAGGNVMPSI